MSMITDLIDRMRGQKTDSGTKHLLEEAAETIEILSEKLMTPAMERSTQYYNGGWIPCEDKLPEVDKRGFSENVLVYLDSFPYFDVCFYRNKDRSGYWVIWDNGIQIDRNVVAWMPLPERYKKEGE